MTVNSLSAVKMPVPATSFPDAAAPVVPVSGESTEPTAAVKPATPSYDVKETLAVIARQMEEYLANAGRKLQFSVDESSGDLVVTVRDAATGATIRQIPSEEVLRVRERLQSGAGGLIDVPA
jgi:flagellar protein FlaG